MRRSCLVLVLVLVLMLGCAPADETPPARLSAVAALRGTAGEVEGLQRAEAPVAFEFPADHGPHDDFAIEWWYFTGNLESAAGEHFGYQLTFFRSALAASDPASDPGSDRKRTSTWATRQVYLAHFAVTDVAGRVFHAAERISRGAAGLAAARAAPFSVWVLDWQAQSLAAGAAGAGIFPLRLEARAEDAAGRPFAIDLVLDAGKPRVLHGDRGLSKKGPSPGNASYYFSRPRMPTRGTLSTARGTAEVTGASWLDREWSTSVLEAGQVGWDWLSLQLADGRELMVFELRRSSGGVDPASHGTLIAASGAARHLTADDFSLEVLDRWHSPRGARYPSRWRLAVPSAALEVVLEPWLADQELDVSFRYWEGAVRIMDAAGGRLGNGYVELVGYTEQGQE